MNGSRPGGRLDAANRPLAALIAGALLALLITAACLTPSPTGHGTHAQLGLTPCSWAMAFGKPCVTCGMTTAFAAAGDGALGAAFAAQPFGALLALLAATGFWGALHVASTGSRLGSVCAKLLRGRVLCMLGGAAAAAWAYKWATWA